MIFVVLIPLFLFISSCSSIDLSDPDASSEVKKQHYPAPRYIRGTYGHSPLLSYSQHDYLVEDVVTSEKREYVPEIQYEPAARISRFERRTGNQFYSQQGDQGGESFSGKQGNQIGGQQNAQLGGQQGNQFIGQPGAQFGGQQNVQLEGPEGSQFNAQQGGQSGGQQNFQLGEQQGSQFSGQQEGQFGGQQNVQSGDNKEVNLAGKQKANSVDNKTVN